jgi:hypothetical protein
MFEYQALQRFSRARNLTRGVGSGSELVIECAQFLCKTAFPLLKIRPTFSAAFSLHVLQKTSHYIKVTVWCRLSYCFTNVHQIAACVTRYVLRPIDKWLREKESEMTKGILDCERRLLSSFGLRCLELQLILHTTWLRTFHNRQWCRDGSPNIWGSLPESTFHVNVTVIASLISTKYMIEEAIICFQCIAEIVTYVVEKFEHQNNTLPAKTIARPKM